MIYNVRAFELGSGNYHDFMVSASSNKSLVYLLKVLDRDAHIDEYIVTGFGMILDNIGLGIGDSPKWKVR